MGGISSKQMKIQVQGTLRVGDVTQYRLLAVCFSLVIGGGYEARRFGKRGMGRDMGAARARRKTDCSLFSCF